MLEADFFEVSDEFVNLANELTQEWAQPMVSAAVMHAASRFNAFHLNTEGKPDDMNVAVEFLTQQYKQMLIENLREIRQSESEQLKGDF